LQAVPVGRSSSATASGGSRTPRGNLTENSHRAEISGCIRDDLRIEETGWTRATVFAYKIRNVYDILSKKIEKEIEQKWRRILVAPFWNIPICSVKLNVHESSEEKNVYISGSFHARKNTIHIS